MAEPTGGEIFPVLPLRDIVVFPHMIVPLFVGREKSVRALEDVMKDDKQILLVTQNDAGQDDPSTQDIYMIGTIGSAALLPWTGGLIDRFELSRYTLAACLLLVFACAYIATTTGPVTLVLAIFLLRHAGQGLISHISITSMVRYFDRERGRAIAFASLGFTAGE